jgi:hypothetical protein
VTGNNFKPFNEEINMNAIKYIVKDRWNEAKQKREDVVVTVDQSKEAYKLVASIFTKLTNQSFDDMEDNNLLPYKIDDLGIEILEIL